MNVTINQTPYDLTDHATVADAVAALDAKPPFAVAVNTQFVPKSLHASHRLEAGDQVEIISPVTGG